MADYELGLLDVDIGACGAYLERAERRMLEAAAEFRAAQCFHEAIRSRKNGQFENANWCENEARAHLLGYLLYTGAERSREGFSSYVLLNMLIGRTGW